MRRRELARLELGALARTMPVAPVMPNIRQTPRRIQIQWALRRASAKGQDVHNTLVFEKQ